MSYDPENVFAKILRGEIPNQTVYEDEHVLAFNDIAPSAPVHVLVIPKGAYVTLDDFTADASPEAQAALMRAIGEVARLTGVVGEGFRVISNNGDDGRQEVPHLHFHIVGGRRLGGFLPRNRDEDGA